MLDFHHYNIAIKKTNACVKPVMANINSTKFNNARHAIRHI